MARSLIAIGTNLGNRAALVRGALAGLVSLADSRLLVRSRLHETAPIGGPPGQNTFLNAAALIETSLAPQALIAELQRIETSLGRRRHERWDARTMDLDLLLYDDSCIAADGLMVPHPRMVWRPFVLEPAAEAAPWMIHSESGWTVSQLLDHLRTGPDEVAVAAESCEVADDLIRQLQPRIQALSMPAIALVRWSLTAVSPWAMPRLLLALPPSSGHSWADRRRMLHLPPTGPVAWIAPQSPEAWLAEAAAAVEAVFSYSERNANNG